MSWNGVFGEIGEKMRRYFSGIRQLNLTLSETVVPILDTLALSREPAAFYITDQSVPATGYVYFENNTGKKVIIQNFWLYKQSGTFTFNQIGLIEPSTNLNLPLYTWASGQTNTNYEPQTPIVLEVGWKVYVNIDSFTGAGTMRVRGFCAQEASTQ